MYRSQVRENDDAYMYRFRTRTCTNEKCRNPARCFSAHSIAMRRRVPERDNHGRFNYIPEHCTQWQKTKKCRLGDSCPRSHGWLEVIFHPLLYKTKMCSSYQKNGVCRKYGVYCAKAHKWSEIRSLVKIYGEDWKRLYDVSMKEKDPDYMSIQFGRKSFKSRKLLFKIPSKMESHEHNLNHCLSDMPYSMTNLYSNQNQGLDIGYKSPKLSSSVSTVESLENLSPIFGSPNLSGTYDSIGYHMANLSLDRSDISYVDLYDETPETSEGYSDFNLYSNSHAVQGPCSQSKTPSVHCSSASFTSNSKFNTPSLDHSEICDVSGSDDSFKVNAKTTERGEENQQECGHDNNLQLLFTPSIYEANRKE